MAADAGIAAADTAAKGAGAALSGTCSFSLSAGMPKAKRTVVLGSPAGTAAAVVFAGAGGSSFAMAATGDETGVGVGATNDTRGRSALTTSPRGRPAAG